MTNKTPLWRFAVKALLLASCLELLCRLVLAVYPFWYQEARQIMAKGKVKYIFIGSSRVASAIEQDLFARNVGGATDGCAVAVNLGRGYSTMAEHYWGLKTLAMASPNRFQGVTVFLEAPLGVPELSSWQDIWFNHDYPELLANALQPADLPAFWRSVGTDFKQKISITTGTLSSAYWLIGKGLPLAVNIKTRLVKNCSLKAAAFGGLATTGGIQTDSPHIRKARELAGSYADQQIAWQKPIKTLQWQESVVQSINDFVSANGGRFVLYDMPLSSVLQRPQLTDTGRRNRQEISRQRAAIPFLTPDFRSVDDDFPDLWHLRSERAGEFTGSLARAFAVMVKN